MENTFKGSKNYVASPELMNAVNIAMALKKPLLIKGEPGTGKTMLAEAVAEALGKKLIIWSVKSTTKAQDGLYVYDVVQRLYDSQFGTSGVDDIAKYIKLGKLGEAFSADEQVVLLIDEVDNPPTILCYLCLLHFLNFCETDHNRCFASKHLYIDRYKLFLRIDGSHNTCSLFPGSAWYYYGSALSEVNADSLIFDAQRLHFLFCERYRLGSRTNKPSHSTGIPDNIPGIVVHDHVDKNIAWEHFSLDLLGNTITHLHNVFQRNPYFQNLILKMSVFNCLLNVGLYLVLITGIGMDNVPFCF